YPALRTDGTAGNRRRKAELYSQARLHVAAPSAWLLERAQRSILAPAIATARVVPNGVDLTVFAPGRRDAARARLGLPPDAHVLVFAAQGARSNPYKDFSTLRAALGRLRVPAIAFALGEDAPTEQPGRVELRSLSFVQPAEVADHLRAADIYVLA